MIKKLFLLTAVLALLVTKTATAAEIYAVLSSDEKTLTFYYDNLRNSRSGTVYDYEYNVEGWNNQIFPEWYACRETVIKAVFDPSMSSARPDNCSYWFVQFHQLKEIENLKYLDTRNETDMSLMFYSCYELTSLDVSSFDTRNVTTMRDMFGFCKSLTSLDLSNFDTHNVTDMYYMFRSCNSLSYVNLSSFDTQNVKYMSYMFEYCRSLTYLNLSNFSTNNIRSVDQMFKGCNSLYAVDLTNFSFESDVYTNSMFSDCSQLRTIYCDNDWSAITSIGTIGMFWDCNSLIGSCGTRYSANRGGIQYAHPDEPGNPGYFTPSTERVGIYVNGEPVYNQVPSNYVSTTEEGFAYIMYYPASHDLYMSNATLTTTGEGIFIPEDVNIHLSGKNRIICKDNGITMLSECYIEGSGSLEINSSEGYGLSFSEGLIAEGTGTLDVYGKLGALHGRPWTDNTGKVNYGYLDPNQEMRLRSDGEHPVVNDLGTIERGDWVMSYDTYSYASPARSVIDTYSKNTVTKPLAIVPNDKISYYPVEIGGQRLNNYNYDDFNPMSLESGMVTYDHVTHTLTMQDAKFVEYETEWETGLEISNYTDFTLQLMGDNSIVGNDENSIYGIEINEGDADETVKRHWRVEGVTTGGKPATLRVKGQIYFESTANDADVTFKNVDIVCEDWAYMWSQDYVDVTIDNCMFDLWNYEDKTDVTSGIVESLQSLTLVDCQLENGCRWDAERSAVLNSSGKPEQKHVKIARGGATWQRGDVNGDGKVNSADVQKTYQLMAQGATGANHPEADINGDGNVNSADIQKIYGIMAEQ